MGSTPDISKGEGFIRTYDLFEHLLDDVYKSLEMMLSDKESQYLRRVFVRNVFACIEGIVQILKYEISKDIRLGRYCVELTNKEKEVLYEEKYRNGDRTKIFIPIDKNVKKTFFVAGKVWGLSCFSLNTDGEKYRAFLKAKETRNRLAHPRTYYDIDITDTEIDAVGKAFEWVRSSFLSLMKEKVKSVSSELPDNVLNGLKNA